MANVVQNSYLLATNNFVANLLEANYKIPKDRILNCYNPRLIKVINKNNENEGKLRDLLGVKDEKLILMCTTWEKVRNKRIINDIEQCFKFDSVDLANYNNKLKERKQILVIKLHPMMNTAANIEDKFSNIKLISNDFICNNNLNLYDFMISSSALITDYSSTFIDFYLMQKPIYFIEKPTLNEIGKIGSYGVDAGFIFENPFEYMAGKIIKTFDDLLSIDIENDFENYKEKINYQNHLWNFPNNYNPCERIENFLIEKEKEITSK